MDAVHVPALREEAIEWLAPERGGLYIDCTLGPGGHAEALLERSANARLLGIDRDAEVLALARERLARFGARVGFAIGNFRELSRLVPEGERAAGILADLGVSSLQLDTPGRGFSFRFDGPLDMRMGASGRTAADIVNESSEAKLEEIFREYGEEPQARRVARAIVEARRLTPFRTTARLAEVVRSGKGRGTVRDLRLDPATRVFQALRIEVNQELEGLEEMLEQAIDLLDQDGRLVVISYHSLEDRIVKNRFRALAEGEIDPITGRRRAETRLLEVLTRKPVRPGAAELAMNPRSRSARLRAARRL